MSKSRLEAFSDGVIAILITIMVLELKVPHGTDWAALEETIPVFLTYVLSFVMLGIYWNNHHHMLFWLSLIPYVTGWMGENHYAPLPTAMYGVVLLLAGAAYFVLEKAIIAAQGPGSRLAAAVGAETRARLSVLLYALAVPLAFVHQAISDLLYVSVALMWLVPDRRIESRMASR
jgi:TMEM175 potassium channel family protein